MRHPIAASLVTAAAMLGALCLVSVPAFGQARTPAPPKQSKPAPRLADGHIDLGNSKGTWNPQIIDDISGSGRSEKDAATRERQKKMLDGANDVPFQPWAKILRDERLANLSKEDPEGYCLPPGIPRMMNTPFPMQMYQLSDRILQVYEGGAHMWRVIYMDGRKHTAPENWNPTYLGESIGHWEGDTLVVDVTGFNDRTWLDSSGHPHTEKLHVIERYTRENEDSLHYQATIDDPGAYTKPWTVGWHVRWQGGWEPYEYICQENNKDVVIENHMVGLRPGEEHN